MEPRTYKVDHIPNDISVINSTLYIANKNFNNVSVFENEGDRLKSKPDIKVGEPQISLETDGNKTLYVLHQNGKSEGKLSIIRVDENRIGNVPNVVPVGMSPKDVKYDVKFKKIYVTNSGSDSVSIIYPAKNFSVKNLDVGLQPRDITIDARTGNVLVVNQASKSISVIDGKNDYVKNTLYLKESPLSLEYGEAEKRFTLRLKVQNFIAWISNQPKIIRKFR